VKNRSDTNNEYEHLSGCIVDPLRPDVEALHFTSCPCSSGYTCEGTGNILPPVGEAGK